MLQIEERHLKIIKSILQKYPYEFFVFGLRAKGTATKFSDLDLCVKTKVNLLQLESIKLEFVEADLPYTVDIISLPQVSAEFRKLIEPDLKKLEFY